MSEYKCPNCGEEYKIDEDGEVIQPCPECGSPEMVKELEDNQKRKEVKNNGKNKSQKGC